MDELKRETNEHDFLEACFHGEIWMRCRLCGKTYEAYFQNRDKETGATYCPYCNGYGRVKNG